MYLQLICTITPASSNNEETHNTLKFAHRAKRIEIHASSNRVCNLVSWCRRLWICEITCLPLHSTLWMGYCPSCTIFLLVKLVQLRSVNSLQSQPRDREKLSKDRDDWSVKSSICILKVIDELLLDPELTIWNGNCGCRYWTKSHWSKSIREKSVI
jgi:hypothetical protein